MRLLALRWTVAWALWGLLAWPTAPAATLYVWPDSPSPTPPYASWAQAARTIQDAVDAASATDEIVVTNGLYATGGRAVDSTSNRVAVTKPVTVRSVNGPAVTRIDGSGAMRCLYLASGAMLAGFTLTNGATSGSGGGVWCEGPSALVSNCVLTGNSAYSDGGGAYGGRLDNCTLTGNSAGSRGGGARLCTLNDCALTANSAYWGGGAHGGTLTNCTLTDNSGSWRGGGASDCELINCVLRGNSATYGGGAAFSTLTDCTLMGNSARYDGGGAYRCTLTNCGLVGNSATFGGGACSGTLHRCMVAGNSADWGGGAYAGKLSGCLLTSNSATSHGGGTCYSTVNNCVLAANSAIHGGGACLGALTNCTLTGNSADWGGGADGAPLSNSILYFNSARLAGANYLGDTLSYCCTTPLPEGPGNLTNAPLFVDTNGWSNLRLQPNSPCINRGDNTYAPGPTDLDGNPRISGGRVDLGAYEFQGQGLSGLAAWLWPFGLPTDGSADAIDSDQDGLTNWQEWQADTDPTNALSVLRILSISAGPPVTVQFMSSSNCLYSLWLTTNLAEGSWAELPSHIDVPGTGSLQGLCDTNAVSPRFYRVGVRRR